MDNVDLKLGTEISDQVQLTQPSRRIKLSEKSHRGVLANMSSAFKKHFVTPAAQETASASVSVAVPEADNNVKTVHPVKPTMTPVTPIAERAKESALDNVALRSVFDYVSHTFSGSSGRMIREGDTMYNNTVAHTAVANVEPTVELGDISSPELSTTDSIHQVEIPIADVGTTKVNVTEMQEAVDDAFTATPEVTPVVDNRENEEKDVSATKVKKASYAKANVEKYNDLERTGVDLPRFTGSDIFNQTQSKVTEQEPKVEEETPKEVTVEPVSNRDVPIVAAERFDYITKANNKRGTATDTSTKFLFEAPTEEVTTVKGEIRDFKPTVFDGEVKDEDVAQYLNKIVELKKAVAVADRRVRSSEEECVSSTERLEQAEKQRQSTINHARAVIETLQASIENKERQVLDFQAQTARNNEAIQRIEAGTRELSDSIPKQLRKAA